MRALLAQLIPTPGDVAANVARCAQLLEESAERADLLVFPELFLSGYDLRRARESAIDPDGDEMAAIREAAARAGTAVLVGFVERRGGMIANALACIDGDGSLPAIYRKTHLFGDEVGVFEAGQTLVVAELGGRDVGPLICFDMEFPETARALARAGARVLVTSAANMEPYTADHELASRARALDNRLPHLYVNRCGEEAGLRFAGGTRAVRADGAVADEVADAGEHLLAARIDFDDALDERVDYVAHSRGDLPVVARTPAKGRTQ